ncbi:MAG: Trm112 family protein [Deferrisomatales bacterium]
MALAPDLLEILVCPQCKGDLEYREALSALLCNACRLRYRIEDDIPVMLIEEATPLEETS